MQSSTGFGRGPLVHVMTCWKRPIQIDPTQQTNVKELSPVSRPGSPFSKNSGAIVSTTWLNSFSSGNWLTNTNDWNQPHHLYRRWLQAKGWHVMKLFAVSDWFSLKNATRCERSFQCNTNINSNIPGISEPQTWIPNPKSVKLDPKPLDPYLDYLHFQTSFRFSLASAPPHPLPSDKYQRTQRTQDIKFTQAVKGLATAENIGIIKLQKT